MARIRTIKPEFPQSESMGRVSRDARLCFVLLWTLADDSGRLRGSSRMLASLLFPYDDDAPALIDGWLGELESESCIARYQADGSTYLQIAKWLIHQKIDKPSASKIPEFNDSSRILANPRERSSLDQGSRTKDLRTKDQGSGPGEAPQQAAPSPAEANGKRGTRLPEDWQLPKAWGEEAVAEGWSAETVRLEARTFRNYWAAKAGKDATKLDWRATWDNWLLKAPKVARPPSGRMTEDDVRAANAAANAAAARLLGISPTIESLEPGHA